MASIIFRLLVSVFIFFSFFLFLNSPSNLDKKVLGQTLLADPANSRARLRFARELMEQGNEIEAQENLKTLLVFDPKNVYASDMLLKSLNNSKEVLIDLEKTIEVIGKRPDYKAAWERLSDLYEIIGDFENAQRAREKASSLKSI